MTTEGLKLFLPAFLIGFLVIIFFWSKVSKRDAILYENLLDEVNRIKLSVFKRFFLYFKIIILLFTFLLIIYFYLPLYFNEWLFQLDINTASLINSIGFHLLKIVLIWLIFVQVFIDKLHKQNLKTIQNQKRIINAQDKLLIGILFLFICYTMTVSNVFFILFTFISFVLYIILRIKLAKITKEFKKNQPEI